VAVNRQEAAFPIPSVFAAAKALFGLRGIKKATFPYEHRSDVAERFRHS